jgi:hypothetical protein
MTQLASRAPLTSTFIQIETLGSSSQSDRARTLKLRLLLRTLTQQLQCLVRAAQSLQLREAHQRFSRRVALRSTRPLPAAQAVHSLGWQCCNAFRMVRDAETRTDAEKWGWAARVATTHTVSTASSNATH